MNELEIVNLLKDLNLTKYEAKALVTLFKFSEADAPTISRNSEIPKTRIYDVLDKLKDRGLVLEIYKSPKTFKVINPNEIFKNLLDSKQSEFKTLSDKVDNIIKNKVWNTHAADTKEKILQINNLKDYNKFLSQEFNSAKKEIHGFTHLDDRFESFKNLSNKDITIKLLSKPVTKNLDIPKNMIVQEMNHSLDAFVLDKKKVIMSLNDMTVPKNTYHISILENNPTLANALLSHFNSYWKE